MEVDETSMPSSADEAEQSDSDQTWQRLLWIPPSIDEPAEQGMLHLDDELVGLIEAADTAASQDGTHGLIEAADTAASQDGTHSAKPEPAVLVPVEGLIVSCIC